MTNNKLDELLSAEDPEDPEERPEGDKKPFEPKFNVREEFAIWIRQEFPELEKYAKKRRVYDCLESRREEIYQAALGAVSHGVSSTKDCAHDRLRGGWLEFEKGFGADGEPKKRAKSLEKFVEAVENLSISLGGNKHFTDAGFFLNGEPYSQLSYKRFNAFIYRAGDENEKNTEYLVFESEQKFEEEKSPVLIGEFTRLAEYELANLKKIAAKFKGTETEFIKEVDKKIPEEKAYHYSSYKPVYDYTSSYYWKGEHKIKEVILPSQTSLFEPKDK